MKKLNEELQREIVERKRAEEKIQEAMKIKAEFISTVSHELRTPLTAIKESVRAAKSKGGHGKIKDRKAGKRIMST